MKKSAGETPWFHICSLLAGLGVFGLGVVFAEPAALRGRATAMPPSRGRRPRQEATRVRAFTNAYSWPHVPVPAIEAFTPDPATWATTLADRPVDIDWLLAHRPERASAP